MSHDRHAESTNTSAPARTPIHSTEITSQSFMASAYAMEADANLNASANEWRPALTGGREEFFDACLAAPF